MCKSMCACLYVHFDLCKLLTSALNGNLNDCGFSCSYAEVGQL